MTFSYTCFDSFQNISYILLNSSISSTYYYSDKLFYGGIPLTILPSFYQQKCSNRYYLFLSYTYISLIPFTPKSAELRINYFLSKSLRIDYAFSYGFSSSYNILLLLPLPYIPTFLFNNILPISTPDLIKFFTLQ